jgi:hypothetical protein
MTITLLKASLLKTDNPFILFKCYLEEITKAHGSSLESLIKIIQEKEQLPKDVIDAFNRLLEDDDFRPYLDATQLIPASTGQVKGKTVTDSPYDYEVRYENLFNFKRALQEANMEDETLMHKIIGQLDKLLDAQKETQQKRPLKKPVGARAERYPMMRTDAGKQNITNYITYINELYTKLIKIKKKLRDSKLDLEGKLIYDSSIERLILELMSNPKNISLLRQYAEGKPKKGKEEEKIWPYNMEFEGGDAREQRAFRTIQQIIILLNDEVTFPDKYGESQTEILVDAILYAYSQKTQVVIAEIRDRPELFRRLQDIKGRGKKILEELSAGTHAEMAEQEIPTEEEEKKRRREKRKEGTPEELIEAEIEQEMDILEEFKRTGRVSWGGFE